MLNVLLWLVVVEAIGLAAFPLCYYLFPGLRDRGYAVSKALGILLIGYSSWILSVLHVLPSTQLTVAALVAVMAGLSWWYVRGRRQEFVRFLAKERPAILAAEAVFLAVFLGWVVYLSYDPAIDHTEQPMDFAFLNASIRSFVGQPEDPWLRGEPVSYYYFGYWMMGALSKLTSIPSSISYNLSLALVSGMGAMGIFGLVSNMVHADGGRRRYAVAGGVGAAFLLVVAASLEGVLEFMRANGMGALAFWDWVRIAGMDGPAPTLTETWRPQEFWWWWHATRVIGTFDGARQVDYVIHEFPSFSYILGDLHPHVMSLPFVALFLTVCWSFLRSPAPDWRKPGVRLYITVLAMGLSLGGLAFTNMWDLPVFSAMLLGTVALKAYSAHGGAVRELLKTTVPFAGAVIGVALVLILPYLLTFTSQVSGIAPVGAYPPSDERPAIVVATTRYLHLLIVWGLLMAAAIPFVLSVFWQTTVKADWARSSLLSLTVGFVPYLVWVVLHLAKGGTSGELVDRLLHVLPFALLVSIATYNALWLASEGRASTGKVFALSLCVLGLLLIMGPELLYVDDSFGGATERMNTIFKLYYQAWIVLAAASGFAIYYWRSLSESVSGWKLHLTRLWAGAFVMLVVGAAYYPVAAAATKGDLFHEGATLNGLAFIERSGRGEYGAIAAIRADADRDSALVEAVGGGYSPFGRISSSTGVPTVLGWPGHELQWRGSSTPFEGREQDVAAIYQTEDIDEAKTLLAKYRVEYVYVGPRELQQYGPEGLDKFSLFMETLFSEGDVQVYRMQR